MEITIMALALGVCLGYILGAERYAKQVSKTPYKKSEQELHQEEIERKHFAGLMNYDAKMAYKVVKR